MNYKQILVIIIWWLAIWAISSRITTSSDPIDSLSTYLSGATVEYSETMKRKDNYIHLAGQAIVRSNQLSWSIDLATKKRNALIKQKEINDKIKSQDPLDGLVNFEG